jgi:hypothetical protein
MAERCQIKLRLRIEEESLQEIIRPVDGYQSDSRGFVFMAMATAWRGRLVRAPILYLVSGRFFGIATAARTSRLGRRIL